jgi:hypothetical protein
MCARLVLGTMLWFQEHLPSHQLHCLLFSPWLVFQSWHITNELTDTVSGGYTLQSWTEKCHALTRSMNILKADAMLVTCRIPAFRFRLWSPRQASILRSAIERTFPIGPELGTQGMDGMEQHVCVFSSSWCCPFRSARTGRKAMRLIRIILACQQLHKQFEAYLLFTVGTLFSFQLLEQGSSISCHYMFQ